MTDTLAQITKQLRREFYLAARVCDNFPPVAKGAVLGNIERLADAVQISISQLEWELYPSETQDNSDAVATEDYYLNNGVPL